MANQNNINVSTTWLTIRLYLLLGVFFGIVLAMVSLVSALLGITSFLFYTILTLFFVGLQYMIGPWLVEISMGVKYVTEKQEPKLHKMISELASKAGIPKPRIGIAETTIPNAFAFGRWQSDGRVCVTRGILNLLNDPELKAVLGHEISHLKNRDVAIITLLSVVPTIAWYLGRSFIFSGGNNKDRSNAFIIGIFAFLVYIVTNLLVLYASRIREYYADLSSVKLGNESHYLASALYKLVYGSAKANSDELHKIEGMKAFFASDPSAAKRELTELAEIDTDKSGHIDKDELDAISNSKVKVSGVDSMMELLSTHPNMIKRISALSKLK